MDDDRQDAATQGARLRRRTAAARRSERGLRSRAALPLAIVLVFSLALALRTARLGTVPFDSGDDISTAWATVWYYPRGMSSFCIGDASLEPNPIGVVTLPHGPLQPLLAAISVTVVDALGGSITEVTWHLPFAVLGSIEMLALYWLGSRLQSRRAGTLAALFAAVLPMHVAFSRTSGESHFVLASLLQVVAIGLWWRYLESRRPLLAFGCGLIIAADVLTDLSFVALMLILALVTGFCSAARRRDATENSHLRALLRWQLVLPIMLATTVHIFALGSAIRSGARVGMLGRLLAETDSQHVTLGGFFGSAALANFLQVADAPSLAVVGICFAAYVASPRARSRAASVALTWACVYALPLLFLVGRERLVGHYISPAIALLLFAALVLDRLWNSAPRAAALLATAVTLSLSLSMLSAVYRVTPSFLFRHASDHGSLRVDRGTKTAALWVRQHTAEDDVVFADAYAQQDGPIGLYYYHRPVIALALGHDTSLASSAALLMRNVDVVDVLVIGVENRNILLEHVSEHAFAPRALITIGDQPSLLIMTPSRSESRPAPAAILNALELNREYDRLYSDLATIIALPLERIQTLSRQRRSN